MDKNLILEIRGRSMELLAYSHEKKVLKQIRTELVAFAIKADREGISSKQREIQMKAIVAKILDESEDGLFMAVAKDVISNFKLIDKYLG